MILPGQELAEGHTFIVALRNLRNAQGRVIKAPAWFQKLRDSRRCRRPSARSAAGTTGSSPR